MANSAVVGLLRVLLTANAAEFDSTLKASAGHVKSFQSLCNSFDGKKLAATASQMAKAIEQVGGAAKLTGVELARVRGVVDATAAKFKALGQDLPPEVAKLRTEIAALDAASGRAAGGGLSNLTGAGQKLGTLLSAVGIAGGVAGLVAGLGRMASAAIESAGHITDLAQKTGLSTDAIQEMQAVADETGTSVEAFSSAAFKLGVNVAEGGKKAQSAIADLGLEYENLRALSPEEQFRKVVTALEGVDNAQERNRLGVALFGKQFSEIAASIESGYSEIADSANKASADQIRALDELGDALSRLKTNISTAFVQVAGSVAIALEDTVASFKLAFADLSQFTEAEQSRIRDAMGQGGEGLAKVMRDIEGARKTDIELTDAQTKAGADYIAQLAAARAELAALDPAQRAQIDAALKLTGASQELADSLGISEEALRLYQDQAREATQHTKELAAEKEKAAKAAEKFRESVKSLTSVMAPFAASVQDAETALQTVGGSLHDLASGTLNETAKATEAARIETEEWARVNGATLAPSIESVSSAAENANPAIKTFGENIKGALADLPKVIQGALQGGGDLGKSVGALFGSSIFGADSGLVKSLTGGLTKTLGKTIGGALGSMLPGLGTALGAGLGALTDKLFGKLFGGEHKQVNKLRDQFTAAAGGINELNKKAQAAGLTLDRFLRAKTVKEYEAAIAELDGAFTRLEANRATASDLFGEIMEAGRTGIPAAYRPAIEQLIQLGLLTDEQADKLRELGDGAVVDVDKMRSAMETLGGRIESLGPAFRQAEIDKTAGQYVNAIDTLIQGGGDVGGVLFDAKEELSKLVNDSLKFGTTLPANMQPWIQELQRAGLLLDENGNKITDTSDLKYGEAMKTEAEIAEEGWRNILKAIKDLIGEIRGPLAGAINSIPDRTVRINYEAGDLPAPTGEGFATGTLGRTGSFWRDFGGGAPTRLHGWEAVVTPPQAVPFSLATLEPLLTRLAPDGGTPGTTTSNTSTNNVALVMAPGGGGLDPHRIANEVFRQWPSAMQADRHGMLSAIEQAIEDYQRTYGNG